jgi:hypothetical protein
MKNMPQIELTKVYPFHVQFKVQNDEKTELVVISSRIYNKAKRKRKLILSHLETA